jgi:hypothetical protein
LVWLELFTGSCVGWKAAAAAGTSSAISRAHFLLCVFAAGCAGSSQCLWYHSRRLPQPAAGPTGSLQLVCRSPLRCRNASSRGLWLHRGASGWSALACAPGSLASLVLATCQVRVRGVCGLTGVLFARSSCVLDNPTCTALGAHSHTTACLCVCCPCRSLCAQAHANA